MESLNTEPHLNSEWKMFRSYIGFKEEQLRDRFEQDKYLDIPAKFNRRNRLKSAHQPQSDVTSGEGADQVPMASNVAEA